MASFRVWYTTTIGRVAITLLVTLFLLACLFWGYQSYLLSELRNRYPSQSDDEKRAQAIASSQKDMPSLEDRADFFLTAPVDFLLSTNSVLFDKPIKLNDEYSLITKNVSIVGRNQAVEFALDFTVSNADRSVTVDGKLEGSVFAALSGLGSSELRLTLSPTVRLLQLNSLALRGFALPEALLGGVNTAIELLIKEVSSRIASQSKVVALAIPEATVEFPIANQAKHITLPAVVINKASALINDNAISILLRSRVGDLDQSTLPDGVPSEFSDLASSFANAVDKSFAGAVRSPNQAMTAISPAFMGRFTQFFPKPLGAESVVAASIRANGNAIKTLQSFDAGAFVSSSLLLQTLNDGVDALKSKLPADSPLRDLALEFSLANQSILFSAQVNDLKVSEGGSIRGFVTGLIAPTPSTDGVDFQIAFSNLEVKAAAISGWSVNPVSVHLVLNSALNVLLPKINALIPPISANVHALRPPAMQLSATSGGPARVVFSPNAIELPELQMGRPVILVSADGLRVALRPIIGATPTDKDAEPAATASEDVMLTDYAERFEAKWKRSFGGYETVNSQIVVSKNLISRYLNAAWPVDGITAAIFIGSRQDIPETTVRAPKIPSDFKCNRRQCTRNSCPIPSCTFNNAGCSRNASCGRNPGECNSDCRREVSYACVGTIFDPIRTCTSSYDDPVCLAQKTACNASVEARVLRCNAAEESRVAACNTRANLEKTHCDAVANAQKAACDAREETLVGACNISAEAEVAACNLKRAAIDSLNTLGDVGSVTGDVIANGSSSISLRRLRFSDDLSSVEASTQLSATIGLNASIQFTPHVGGAILACAPVRLTPQTKAEVSELLTVAGTGVFSDSTSAGELSYLLTLQPIAISATVRPAPLDALFINNPEFLVLCPIVANAVLLADLVGKGVSVFDGSQVAAALSAPKLADVASISGLVDVANGSYSANVPLDSITLNIPLAKFSIGEKDIVLAPRNSGNTIVFQ